jgi:hypothetical protein
MAVIYLRSTDGNDGDNGSTWALAKATLQAAVTAAGVGGTVYVSKSHSESYVSATTVTFPGTTGPEDSVKVNIFAVDDTGNPEPPTTLTNKDSAATANFDNSLNLILAGAAYIYGVEFSNSGAVNASIQLGIGSTPAAMLFEDCLFNLLSTGSSGGRLQHGGSSNTNMVRSINYLNCDFNFANASICFDIDAGSNVSVSGGAILSVGTSVNVFQMDPGADRSTTCRASNLDLSGMTADDYLVGINGGTQVDFLGRRLKIPASIAGLVDTPLQLQPAPVPPIRIHSFGAADEYYQFYEQSYAGYCEDSTAVYRTGGATYDGTNEFSVKMGATTGASTIFPLRFKLAELKLDLTSSKTLTVHTAQNAGTVYQDDEFWIEAEYPDSTGLALGVIDKTPRPGPLDTPANLTSSAETWTASGSEDTRQVAITIGAITGATDAQVTVWACLAKPSGEIYVCPKVEIS